MERLRDTSPVGQCTLLGIFPLSQLCYVGKSFVVVFHICESTPILVGQHHEDIDGDLSLIPISSTAFGNLLKVLTWSSVYVQFGVTTAPKHIIRERSNAKLVIQMLSFSCSRRVQVCLKGLW